MGKQLTSYKKGQITAFKASGKSARWIAMEIGFHRSTVYAFLNNLKAGIFTRKVGSGRPRKTSPHTDRLIVRHITKNRFSTANDLKEEFPTLLGGEDGSPTISDSTIRRRIKESGKFKSYWAAKKPFISLENKRKRVEWGKAHRNWTKEQWSRVMWTDESPFVLRFNRKKRVWRMHNERYNPICTIGTVKHDKKIMVWGCFAAHGIGHLHKVNGIMEHKQYKQILIHHMKPSLKELFPDGDGIFQQDNDPKHTETSIKAYLDNEDSNIPQLPIVGNHRKPLRWPAQSPDLNPIENLWSILDLWTKKRKPNNEIDLLETLQEAWHNIPVSLLTKLSDSMPDRIEEMLKNKGNATSY